MRNVERRYVLTPLGRKALNQLKQLNMELTAEDEKYIKLAQKTQRTSIEPAVKSFLIICIAVSLTVVATLAGLIFTLLTQGAFFEPMSIVLVLGIIIEVAVAATLIYALRRVPDWLRRLERRFLTAT